MFVRATNKLLKEAQSHILTQPVQILLHSSKIYFKGDFIVLSLTNKYTLVYEHHMIYHSIIQKNLIS